MTSEMEWWKENIEKTLEKHDARMEKLDENKADLKDLNAVVEEMRSLRKALLAFAFTVAGSAIVFAFTLLEVVKP